DSSKTLNPKSRDHFSVPSTRCPILLSALRARGRPAVDHAANPACNRAHATVARGRPGPHRVGANPALPLSLFLSPLLFLFSLSFLFPIFFFFFLFLSPSPSPSPFLSLFSPLLLG